jgi:hypothetical protein
MLLLAGGTLRADASPAEVLTPAALACHFRVRADVRPDAAGRPVVIPLEAIASDEEGA